MTSTRTLKRGIAGAMMALLVALTLMAIAVPAVSAHEPDSDVARERAVHGFRTVGAAGNGIAHLHGRYVQEGSIGAGALIVSANAEVRVDGFERRIVIGDGSVLGGFKGSSQRRPVQRRVGVHRVPRQASSIRGTCGVAC